MDPSGPASHTEPLDLLAPAAEAPGSRPGESLIWVQDAIVFSGDYAATGGSLPAQAPLSPEHQGVGSCSLEVAAWDCEVPAGEFACVSGRGGGPAECAPGSSPGPELPTMEFPPPPEEVLQVGNPQAWDEGANDAQALIWAGILQAQQCMLELQGALEKQEEPAAELSSQAQGPEDAPSCGPATQSSQAWPVSCEPLGERTGLASSSEEEPEAGPGGQEEEEEESASSEEEQHLFYNNPLFQESPRTGPSPCGSPAGGHGTAPEGTPVLGAPPEGELWHQGAEAEAPGEVPAYTPHCGSWAPLLITEGDIDRARSMTEEPELLSTCGSNTSLPALQDPDQPADGAACHPPVLLESGESGAAEDPLGSGLLFSPSGSSVVWALLQEEDGAQPSPCEGPPSPAPDRGSSSPLHPAEPVLHPEVAWGLPASGHGDLAPPSLGAEASPSVSCPQGEAAEAEALPESLAGEERKPGDVAQGQATEEPGEEAKQELTVRCPEEEDAGETPGDPEAAQPDGPILANGASGDKGAAWRLAARLYRLDGFKKSQVASYLRKNNEFSQQVAEEYLAFFQFGGQTLDRALRSFLKAFVLTGETQERERILGHFSKRYHLSNPDAFPSADTVHTLTCALMLLNTDLHGQNIGRSMTCHEFVTNLDGMKDGQNFPKEQLKALYSSIRNEKLEWAMDEEEQGSALMPRRPSTPSSRKKSNPFLTLAHDANAATYKQGLLARKVHAEADGKKTPWGKRGWKTFHTVLKGMVLYFLKDESQVEVAGTEEPIGVHHALAERASKYNKRPHVFRLQTADWRIFLFQALSAEEMSSWISRINLVAAMFSSPPFPAAVGSQRKFIRPILPTAQSRSSLEEQHQAHETCMDKFTDELGEHQRNLPDKRGRGRDLEEYRLKKEYLLYEKRRYETYVRLLEARLQGGPEELEQWEARLGGLDLADEGLGLTKSHSSPSLNLDPAPTGVKVKRNISERRTVRKIIPKRNKQLL
ncbi:PH and SEC7 domain-containing protein 4-like isoform X2 [Pelodiscus sinensis]|uniref:PH and SEC7 domain-containing protein 4-like isoform X2 n=1 Tax=Pelodiscus sinensis TaxID=13735 RepID=UPI003F6B395F